jgi:hypothetical protein
MHCSNIGKTTANTADSKFCSRLSFEEKQAGILFIRIGGFFLLGVDIVENLPACFCLSIHCVYNFYSFIRVNIINLNSSRVSPL